MLFRQLFDCESCTYTYLIASGQGREALLIDPVLERLDVYTRLLEELQLKLVITLETHTHADHITAASALQEQCRSKIAMGSNTKAKYVDIKVKEGEKLKFDGLQLEAIYTPGHTDDSYSYRMADRVFTGDTLLIRATGRTDFQGGSASKEYDSLFNKLLTLPQQTLVYPAHDYNGVMVSTIEEEIKFNPRLQVSSEQEYVSIMAELDLARPEKMDAVVPANLCCGRPQQ